MSIIHYALNEVHALNIHVHLITWFYSSDAPFLDIRFKAKYLEHLGESEWFNVKQKTVDEYVSTCSEGQQQRDTNHSHTMPVATSDVTCTKET